MTDQSNRGAPIAARVIEIVAADEMARTRPIGPQAIATERTEPITPSERSVVVVAPPPARRRDGVITFELASIAGSQAAADDWVAQNVSRYVGRSGVGIR